MSQTTEIPFIGVHNTTTENLNENGEVAMSFGLTSNDVAATTTMPAVTHLYHIDGCRILLIHNGSGFKNVFVARPSYDDNGEVKKWTTEAYTYEALNNPDETPAIMCSEPGLPNSTAVLGNVVVLNYDDRCRYAFRKNDTYVIRDNTLPPIVFEAAAYVKLVGKAEVADGQTKFHPDNDSGNPFFKGMIWNESSEQLDEYRGLLYDQYISLKSSWAKYGYLCSPILIRMAYRLKTGELVGHTNPVLCMPNLTGSVMTAWADKTDNNVLSIVYTPFVKIISCAYYEEYGDIIDSIDVFTSVQIERDKIKKEDIIVRQYFDDNGNFFPLYRLSGFNFRYYHERSDGTLAVSGSLKIQLTQCLFKELDAHCIEQVDNFYFCRSIHFSFIGNMNGSGRSEEEEGKEGIDYVFNHFRGYRRVFMDYKFNYVDASNDSISTRERMTDPIRPNAKHIYSNIYSYNKRMLGLVDSFAYEGNSIVQSYFSSYYFYPICKVGETRYSYRMVDIDYLADSSLYDMLEEDGVIPDASYIYINGELVHNRFSLIEEVRNISIDKQIHGCIFEVSDNISGDVCYIIAGDIYNTKFLTCEDPNARKAFGFGPPIGDNTKMMYRELDLRKHDLLNMAIADTEVVERELDVGNNDKDRALYNKILDILAGKQTYRITNNDYIRLSNVGDPYSFDASNTAYFNSPVERVMIVPEAITLGQYGTDQIYVICQDGVYTVGLNDEGKLTRVNTFTSDKIDANRACIAGGQLFVNNGISWDFYQGQNRNQFLSMKRNTAFHFDNLPHILSLNETKQWEWCLQGDNLFDFMQRCTLYYDSINAQIIGVVPNTGFYLVWSKDDGFRMVKSNAEYRVQYNTLLLADNNSNLYDFEATDTVQQDDGMVIMRPFHLNAEQKNGLSTVRSVIVRGNFDSSTSNCAVKIILYGTMDYKTWHVVASSTRYYITGISGTPYAAFRLVILARLKRDEYLSHITVEYDNKESKRLHF